MRKKMTFTTLALVLPTIVFAIILPTVTEGGRLGAPSQPAQKTSPSGAPQSCRLPWTDDTDPASFQVIYNAQDDEFAVLGIRYINDWEWQNLIGLRLSPTGRPLGEPITVTLSDQSTLPTLAYNPTTDRYLAVWGTPGRYSGLEAQMLEADLSPATERISMNATNGHWPSVAYNPDDDEFVVVWQEEAPIPPWLVTPTPSPQPTDTAPTGTPTAIPRPTGTPPTPAPQPAIQSIFAQRVRGDGSRVGPVVIPVVLGSTPEEAVTSPKVLYNPREQEYLVVWARSEPEPGLYGRRLSRTGELLGEVIPLAVAPAVPYRPLLVYNSTDNQYLLVWADAGEPETHLVDVYGMLLSAQGEPVGEPFVIRGTARYEAPTGAVYNPVENEYLVAWDMNLDTEVKPTLQRLSTQGEPIGEPIETLGGVFGMGVNTKQGSYLVLEGFGFYARPLGVEPYCPPAPTPTAPTPTPWTTPTPTPGVLQWQGTIGELMPGEFHPSGRKWAKWLIEDTGGQTEIIVVTQLTRVDEHLGRAELGAKVWASTHIQTLSVDRYGGPHVEFVSDEVAILPGAESIATPTATATRTPTATPTATATPQSVQHGVYLPYVARIRSARP